MSSHVQRAHVEYRLKEGESMSILARCGCILGLIGLLAGCTPQERHPTGTTVAFYVPDMMCAEGCGAKVNEILSEQPGARKVHVDFESKSASVDCVEGKFDPQVALAALVDHGFDNSSLKKAATVASGEQKSVTQP